MEQREPPSFLHFLAPLLAGAGLLVGGIVTLSNDGGWILFSAGAAAMVLVLALYRVHRAIEQSNFDARRNVDLLAGALGERIQRLADVLERIAEQQLISDRAKTIAYRHKDLETLRAAIRNHIARDEFEPANALADELERTMAAPAEASQVRLEVAAKRQEWFQRRMSTASAHLEELCRAERWTEARAEAERIAAENPDVDAMRNLPQEVVARREAFKRQLRESWHEAAYRGDVDTSISVLRRLDPYLSAEEAEEMEETVRGIFREKMNRLRAEFTKAVHDERWPDAIRVGETIARDFPNARIAQEVRETMTALRQRAGLPPATTAPEPPPPQRPATPLERVGAEAANRA